MADVTSPFGFPYPEPTDLVRDGATDIEALAEAANDQFLAGFQFAGQRIYTSSGEFVKADPLGTGDIGLRAVRVTVVGGGGGGGGSATGSGESSFGDGGGGGGGAVKVFAAADLSDTTAVTRGGGGAGGTGAANGSGGGQSVFEGVTGGGGAGASHRPATTNNFAALNIATNVGGTSSGGDYNFAGSPGGNGLIARADTAVGVMPGSGGSSVFGSGAGAAGQGGGVAGDSRGGFGGGGSGARLGPNRSAETGGAGGPGIVIVEVFV